MSILFTAFAEHDVFFIRADCERTIHFHFFKSFKRARNVLSFF